MIVETVAAMAKGLGLQVSAEGVETPAQLARLRAIGCEEWQGHLFSEPLEAAAFERLAQGERAAKSA
jgi:EAL domain-containing protein (putative c-di-GMP-specific phosphodiesterase class I)